MYTQGEQRIPIIIYDADQVVDIPLESTSPGRGETSAPSVVTEGSDDSDKVGSDAATYSSGDQPTEQFDERYVTPCFQKTEIQKSSFFLDLTDWNHDNWFNDHNSDPLSWVSKSCRGEMWQSTLL